VGEQAGEAQSLLAVASLTKHFPLKGGLFNRTKAVVQAVDDVSFAVQRGDTWALSESPAAASRPRRGC
jgi:peptide/nickel transport system ATP-binding protein